MLFDSLVAFASGSDPVTVSWGNLITANSFDGIVSGINTVLPVVVPFALTVMGIGIVWRFVKKFVKSK